VNCKKTKQITVFSGCVIKGDKVLMVLRNEPECPEAHLKWEFPGGKVDFEETPEESVAREIFEETGVEVKVKELLPWVGTSYWEYEWGTQQTLCFVYVCEYISQKKVKKDHHVEKIEWVKIVDVKKLPSLPGTYEVIDYLNRKIG
jgi:8-oxo-dGTP diphosphatase